MQDRRLPSVFYEYDTNPLKEEGLTNFIVVSENYLVLDHSLPIFCFRKNDVLNHAGVRTTMTNYVKAHNLMSNEDKRYVPQNVSHPYPLATFTIPAQF